RLRARDAGPVDRLFLRTPPDDARLRRRPALEEVALASLGLEEHELALGKGLCERDPRCTAARADVDDRAGEALDEWKCPQRVLEQNAPRLLHVPKSRQPRRRNDRGQPVVK